MAGGKKPLGGCENLAPAAESHGGIHGGRQEGGVEGRCELALLGNGIVDVVSMRSATCISLLVGVSVCVSGCCLLGPPQAWSFATVCPRNADLVGRYNAEIHGPPGSSLGARPAWIVLDADMTFKAGVATTARGASDQQTLHGTWAVAPFERTSHYKWC